MRKKGEGRSDLEITFDILKLYIKDKNNNIKMPCLYL